MNVRYKNKEKMSVISVLDNALQTTVKSGLIEFNDSKKAQIF